MALRLNSHRFRAAGQSAVVLALLFSAGCSSPSKNPFRFYVSWGIFVDIPMIPLVGPPPREIDVAREGFDALAEANQDGFFPADTVRALVSDEAMAAGLFRAKFAPDAALDGTSPDGQWHTHRRATKRVGDVVDVQQANGGEQRYFWSIGNFTELLWSPDSTRFGLNEARPAGGRSAFLIDVAAMDQQPVTPRTAGLQPFFTPTQLDAELHRDIKGWLNAHQFILWVRGDLDEHGLPRWGYEVVVDCSVPESAINSRLLRAYHRIRADSPGSG